jgi:hypothetical protein
MSYEKPGALSNRTDNRSPEAARTARRRRRVGLFFAGWTVFASLAVWWLVRRAETANMDPSWFFEGDAGANGSVAERIGNWFKLADLNFHGIYPWILLAPYVAWLGARFHLERGQWRVSVPAHLAACALFVIASHALDTYSDWGRQVVVKFTTQTRISQDGKKGGNATTGQTNEFTIVTNIPWASLPAPLPGPWGGGQMRQTARAGPTNSPSGSEIAWAAPGNQGVRGGVFIRKHFLGSLLDLLDPCAYAVLVGIVHTVHFYRRSREREGRAAALEAQLTKARLNALQAQLHPHFLFNALNAISTLLRRDTRAAQDALASFSELLRLALCQSTQPEVTLREDLEFLRRYVEIQQTRLGDRLPSRPRPWIALSRLSSCNRWWKTPSATESSLHPILVSCALSCWRNGSGSW